MSDIYKSTGKERVIFELSRSDRYLVELIQGDNGKQLVRKRLIDLEQKEQFIKKSMMMFSVSQAEVDNIGFAKILFIDTAECYYIMEYISGPILSKIIDQIDIVKDSADIDVLEVELCKRIDCLSHYGTYNLTPSLDQFLLDNNGELIWYNYCDAPEDSQVMPQYVSAQEIARQIIDSIRHPKLEALRIAQEKAQKELERQEQALAKKAEAQKKRNKLVIICTGYFSLAAVLLYILFATPFINFVKATLSYDTIVELNQNYYLVTKDGKYGTLDQDYNTKLEADYQSIKAIDASRVRIEKNGKYGVAIGGQIKIKPQYDVITQLQDKSFSVEKDNKYGLYSIALNKLYPAKYDSVISYTGGYVVLQIDNQYGLSFNCEEVCPISYDKIKPYEDSFIVYRGKNCIEYSTTSHKFIYEDSDYIPYKANGKYGFKNPVGDILIAATYTSASPFIHNMAKVSKIVGRETKYGLIDHNGEIVIEITCDAIGEYNSEFIIAKLKEGWAAFKIAGASQVTQFYDKVTMRDYGFTVYRGAQSMQTDKYGEYVYRPSDLVPHKFNTSSDPWGYVDLFGNTVIKPQYCKVEPFSKSGYAKVEVWGFLWNDHYTINIQGDRL